MVYQDPGKALNPSIRIGRQLTEIFELGGVTGQAATDKAIAMLAPGQQASITDKGNIEIKKDADIDGALAWKNGMFRLTSSDVPTIMRQLARWYDVEIEFEGGVPAGHITGEVPRNTSLSKVLKVFETSGVHFRIVGKKIVVKQ